MMTFLTIATVVLGLAITSEMLRMTFKLVGLDLEVAPERPVGRIARVGRKCGS